MTWRSTHYLDWSDVFPLFLLSEMTEPQTVPRNTLNRKGTQFLSEDNSHLASLCCFSLMGERETNSPRVFLGSSFGPAAWSNTKPRPPDFRSWPVDYWKRDLEMLREGGPQLLNLQNWQSLGEKSAMFVAQTWRLLEFLPGWFHVGEWFGVEYWKSWKTTELVVWSSHDFGGENRRKL